MALRGTIKELIAKNVSLNGVKLGAAEISVLTRLGNGTFAKNVGNQPKPAGTKGKHAIIWELDGSATLNFTAE